MATVTHGLKDGIDEILEKANALDNILKARAESIVADAAASESAVERVESKLAAIEDACLAVGVLRTAATAAREKIENVRRAAA